MVELGFVQVVDGIVAGFGFAVRPQPKMGLGVTTGEVCFTG